MAALPSLELPRSGALVPERGLVVDRARETRDTWTLAIEPGLAAAPGQFTMLYAYGVGEVPISISGDLTRPGPLVHTIREVGAVSRALCATEPGRMLGVRGPYGTGWPVAAAEGADVVVVTGGIGLAPLRPALHHLLAHRGRYGRVSLLYGARTPADILYADELRGWRSRFDLDVAVTVDAAEAGWRGRVGLVTDLVPATALDPGSAVALVCGPELMMRFVARALEERGLARDRIHVSLERTMRCGTGHCGHCQLGPKLVCRDGPVFPYADVADWMEVREL